MIMGCSNCIRTAVVSCRLEDDSEFVVMLDTKAYLLNDNGITLSKKAHKEFHAKYGKTNNTKEQLQEFLSNN